MTPEELNARLEDILVSRMIENMHKILERGAERPDEEPTKLREENACLREALADALRWSQEDWYHTADCGMCMLETPEKDRSCDCGSVEALVRARAALRGDT